MLGNTAIALVVLLPVIPALWLVFEQKRGRRPGLIVAAMWGGLQVNTSVTATLAAAAIVKSIDPHNGLVTAVRGVLEMLFA